MPYFLSDSVRQRCQGAGLQQGLSLACQGDAAVHVQAAAGQLARSHLGLEGCITELCASLHVQSAIPAHTASTVGGTWEW